MSNTKFSKLQEKCKKFNSFIDNIITPKFIRPTSEDFKNNKLKYMAKLSATMCWAAAVTVTSLTVAPIPTLAVIGAQALSRKITKANHNYLSQHISFDPNIKPKKPLAPKIYDALRGLSKNKESQIHRVTEIKYNPSLIPQNKRDL